MYDLDLGESDKGNYFVKKLFTLLRFHSTIHSDNLKITYYGTNLFNYFSIARLFTCFSLQNRILKIG